MRRYLASLHFPRWSIPLVLAAVSILAYGLLLPFWGLYLDDWHHVYFDFRGGLQGLQDFFLFDSRPLAWLFYGFGFNVLGYNALAWQVVALGLRTLTAVLIWLCLREIWREHEREMAWTAVLFLVYPLFRQQQFSVAYSMHWFGYALFVVSIWCMVLAIKRPSRFVLFTILSLSASLGHLFFLEYFAGLELIRPVVIWILVRRQYVGFGNRLRRTLLLWLPYLSLWILFVIYRLYLMPRPKPGYERNQLLIISDFIEAPLSTALHFIQNVIQDTITILFTSWQNAISPSLFSFRLPANLLAIGVIFLSGVGLYVYFTRLRLSADEVDKNQEENGMNNWWIEAFFLGLLLVLLGVLPIWLTDQFIVTDNPLWSDRYSLAGLFGASLVVVSLISGLVTSQNKRTILLSLLVGFSIGWNLLVGNEYRWSWTMQNLFFHQLAWRAPYLEPGTTILSEGELFSRMTEYETSFAISTLYPKTTEDLSLDYWFFSLGRRYSDRMADLLSGLPVHFDRHYTKFDGDTRDSLVISFDLEKSRCLWMLSAEDQAYVGLPSLTRQASVISNLELIKFDTPDMQSIPTEIFGPAPDTKWCYYYQKADLARQIGDWDTVVEIWQEADNQGVTAGHGLELIPFIHGFSHVGDWDNAIELTNKAKGLTFDLDSRLCAAWQTIQSQTDSSPEREMAVQQIQSDLDCDFNISP